MFQFTQETLQNSWKGVFRRFKQEVKKGPVLKLEHFNEFLPEFNPTHSEAAFLIKSAIIW